METVIDIIQCWQGCEEMKTITEDSNAFVQASGILECPHAASTMELLPLGCGSSPKFPGLPGVIPGATWGPEHLWVLQHQNYAAQPSSILSDIQGGLPATALNLTWTLQSTMNTKSQEFLQNSRTGIYNLLVPDKHWITADTPKLARASALPKVHWCFCETVTLQETQCHQEKSSIQVLQSNK